MRFCLAVTAVLAIALGGSLAAAMAPAQTGANPVAPVSESEEGWSFDDIKDVCEAAQFVMLSIAIGAGMYWFWCRYLPAKNLPRVEFDVDVQGAGESDSAWIVDVVACVKNLGASKAELVDLRFRLESVDTDRLSSQTSLPPAADSRALLFEGEWTPAPLILDPGTRGDRSFVAAVPKTVSHVFVTATLRNPARAENYAATRLHRITG